MNLANITDGEPGLSVRNKLNAMKDAILSSAHLGKVRVVYLIQDAADVTHLTGNGNNVYQTAQDAYNAANALQVALGGSNKVVILVGNTTSATVGDITLTANWNHNVEVVGIAPNVSQIGNIIATNNAGNGYRVGFTVIAQYARFNGVKIGNITTSATGAAGNSGIVGLGLNNCEIGNIDTTITDVANTTGTGGNVQVGSQTSNGIFVIGNITTTAKGTAAASGSVVILANALFRIGSITTANNTSGGSISIQPSGKGSTASIYCISSTSGQGTLTLLNVDVNGTTTITNDTTARFTNSSVSGVLTYNELAGGDAELIAERSKFARITLSNTYKVKVTANNMIANSIDYLGDDSIITNSVIDIAGGTANNGINDFGSNCVINNTFIRAYVPQYGVYSTNAMQAIKFSNVVVVGGVANAYILNNNAIEYITENPAGTHDADCSKADFFDVQLNGGAAGANTLNLLNIAGNKTYRVQVTNNTGTDTLTIVTDVGGASGLVFLPSGAYVPSATGRDVLTIHTDDSGNAYLTYANY